MPSLEESFPRGGAQTLTSLEVRQAKEEAILDFDPDEDLGAQEVELKSAKKRSRSQGANDDLQKQKKQKSESAHIEFLAYKRLAVGMKLLGCVKEVNDLDIVLSLPNQLTGFVSIAQISPFITSKVEAAAGDASDSDDDDDDNDKDQDEAEIPDLRDFFQVGQFFPCVIAALEDSGSRRRIELSMMPRSVNASIEGSDMSSGMVILGSISSEQDHVYQVDLGVEGYTGLLPKKLATEYESKYGLQLGQLILVAAKKVNHGNKTVSLVLDAMNETRLSKESILGFDQLQPGYLVNVKISSISKSGLAVRLQALFTATIDLNNLDMLIGQDESLEEKFSIGDKIKARIIYVDAARKRIGLSVNSRIVSLDAADASPALQVGDKLEMTVLRADYERGLVLVPTDGSNSVGYAHGSRIIDSDEPFKMTKHYRAGTTHQARIISLNPFDNIFSVSLQPSVLNEAFLSLSDLKTGMLVKNCKVLRLTEKGMVVSVSDSISGFVPAIHMSDVMLRDPSKLFKVGATIKCQVISCDPDQRRLILTHKKSLLSSRLPILSSYDNVKPGEVYCGVINGFIKDACFISFYNSVKGFVHVSEMSDEFTANPSENHKIGQTVKCRVLSVREEDLKMSLRLAKNPQVEKAVVQVGQLVSGKIVSNSSETGIVVSLSDIQDELKASMSFAHLSDVSDSEHTKKLAACFKEGQVLKACLVIAIDRRSGEIKLSRKPSLVDIAKSGSEYPVSVASLQTGASMCGYVKKILDSGCIVGFLGGLQGFARIHSISDRYVSDIRDHLVEGQSLVAKISEIDTAQDRFTVNLKDTINFPSSLAVDPSPYESKLLESLFAERDLICKHILSKGESSAEVRETKLAVGQPISGSIKQILPYGSIVQLDNLKHIVGLITNRQAGDRKFTVNESVDAFILDYDMERKIVDLCLSPGISQCNSKILQQLSSLKKPVDAKIEMIKEDYAIASIPSMSNCLCFTTVKTPNSKESAFLKYKEGQTVQIAVTHTPSDSSAGPAGSFNAQKVIGVTRSHLGSNGMSKKSGIDTRKKLNGPIDKTMEYMDQLTPGACVQVRIKSIKSNQINVEIASNLNGRIHITELCDDGKDLEDMKNPFASFENGQILSAKVVGFHDIKTNSYLPLSKPTSSNSLVVDFTLKKSDLELENGQLSKIGIARYESISSIEVGTVTSGFIQRVAPDAVWVYLAPNLLARAFVLDCADSSLVLENLSENFSVSQFVECRVIGKDESRNALDLSFRLSKDSEIKPGNIIPGRISRVDTDTGLMVQVSGKTFGRVYLTDISDQPVEKPTASFNRGEFVDCYVLAQDVEHNRLDLSLRDSRISEMAVDQANPEIKDIGDVKFNMVVSGYVKNTSESGCFVSLNRNLAARVKICDLSDLFIKDWKAEFPKGKLVEGRILGVNEATMKIEMTLKKSQVHPTDGPSVITFGNLAVGGKHKGRITKIERYGVFIKFENSKVSGLCHINEMSDEKITSSDIGSYYSVGDVVKAIVLNIEDDKRRISLGLKPSYFKDEDAELEESENEDSDAEMDEAESLEGEEEEHSEEEEEHSADEELGEDAEEQNGDMESESDIEEDEMDASMDARELVKNAQPLEIIESENEASDANDSEDVERDSQDEGQMEQKKHKKSRKEKNREKAEKEALLKEKENLIASGDAPPETAQDYERLLLGAPSSSYIWIKYMAFQFGLAEIGKAREIAERALKTISFREEKEKMNIWVAYLNLEFSYGTSESLKKVFDRAVAGNDPEAIYMHMAQIYARSDRTELAIEFHAKMVKKFKTSSKVWTSAGLFHLMNGRMQESRDLLERSLISLPKHKHIETISKFAQYEFKHGEPERGRTIFEGLLSNYPKRADLWSVYLDMEIKVGQVDTIRRLFERVISLKFSSKKMKFFFKKYLTFEQGLGEDNGGRPDHVKQSAMEYVDRLQESADMQVDE